MATGMDHQEASAEDESNEEASAEDESNEEASAEDESNEEASAEDEYDEDYAPKAKSGGEKPKQIQRKENKRGDYAPKAKSGGEKPKQIQRKGKTRGVPDEYEFPLDEGSVKFEFKQDLQIGNIWSMMPKVLKDTAVDNIGFDKQQHVTDAIRCKGINPEKCKKRNSDKLTFKVAKRHKH